MCFPVVLHVHTHDWELCDILVLLLEFPFLYIELGEQRVRCRCVGFTPAKNVFQVSFPLPGGS